MPVHQFENSFHLPESPSFTFFPNSFHLSFVNHGVTSLFHQVSILSPSNVNEYVALSLNDSIWPANSSKLFFILDFSFVNQLEIFADISSNAFCCSLISFALTSLLYFCHSLSLLTILFPAPSPSVWKNAVPFLYGFDALLSAVFFLPSFHPYCLILSIHFFASFANSKLTYIVAPIANAAAMPLPTLLATDAPAPLPTKEASLDVIID